MKGFNIRLYQFVLTLTKEQIELYLNGFIGDDFEDLSCI